MLKRLAFLLAFFALPALADVQIKSGAGTDTLTVNTNKAALITEGVSTRPTYTATVSGATTTAAYNLQVESAAGLGFKVTRVCVGYSGATAGGTVITTTISRRTTASSVGTALTNEGTGTTSISKHDPADATFTGLARGLAATLGTAGATIDQWSFVQPLVATNIEQVCKDYGIDGKKTIVNAVGVTNGIAVQVSAGGAGSVAAGSISMTLIAE